MDFPNTAWLQQSLADLSHVASDGQHTTNEEWKDQSGASATTTMDLGDFGLGDLSVPSSSSSSNAASSTTPFYTFGQHTSYYPGPFNAVSYGTSQWNGAATQLPLSSYSSLNGATSASPPSQPQQQSGPSSSSSMLIDPALTMTGASSPPSQQYQHSVPFLPPHSLSQPQQRTQYQYQQQPQQSTFSINSPYAHTMPTHYLQSSISRSASQHQFPQSQAQASQVQPPTTLSPYLLQSNSLLSALPPSSFYGTPAPAPIPAPVKVAPTPEERKATLQTAIKPLLTPTSFTGAGAVSQLVRHIEDHGIAEVEPSIRLEVLTKMRDNAGNHYFRAWVENEDAMDITREWLKSAYAAKDDSQHLETIMPMLHIIDRLPMTLECLKASKLGKIVVRLVKDPPAPAIKDMASNLERKWRQLLVSSHEDSKRMDVDDDAKGKKRKADTASAKSAPASKKAAVSTSTSSAKPVAVKKEGKSVVKEVKDAKSDSSFFSGPKPKPKLPSFKKAPPPSIKKEPDPNVAQPSSFNPFEEALKSMAKARKDSPATATPPPTSAPPITVSSSLTANGKPRKRVTWAPEGELERVKLIERAIYDDDPADGMFSTHNLRDLDRDEGAALHAHLFEEQIEWSEPSLIEMPPEIDDRPMGAESQEKVTQEQREQGALVALYVSEAQIPESPDEPPTQLTEEQTDEGVKVMLTGPDVDAIFWTAGAPAAVEPPKQSVAELVGQLAAASGVDAFAGSTSAGAPPQSDSKPFGLDTNAIQALPGVSNLNPEQLQQLVQALSQNQSAAFPSQAPGQPAPSADWNNARYPPDYDHGGGGYHAEGPHDRRWADDGGWAERGAAGGRGAHRGRGRGRGRGGEPFRNNKRRPCSFFAAGRCKYGDQCDFSHEPIY